MKFVHITFRFEYMDLVEKILDDQGVVDFVRYSMIEGKDKDGKHFGSQIFPGSVTVCQALVEDHLLEGLLGRLKNLKDQKKAHGHLRTAVMPVEMYLGEE